MYSVYSRKTLLGLTFSLFLTHAVMAEQRFYPSTNQSPMIVGKEEFKENYLSLAGLEGVHVVTRYVSRSARKYKITDMPADLVKQIDNRLGAAGLRMLDAKDVKTTPGQPTLTFYPGYSIYGTDKITLPENTDNKITDRIDHSSSQEFCRSTIWASFFQSATILRNPNQQFKFITWGVGDKSDVCENRGAWTYNAILKVVDKFIADYKKAESEHEREANLKTVTNANEVPKSCTQAWTINQSVFENNETRINEAVKPILNKLAETATRCEQYRYIIEIFSNQSTNAEYNRILSEARAHAIKDYLLIKNISHHRLETVAFSAPKPQTSGATEEKTTDNRRVVITPQL